MSQSPDANNNNISDGIGTVGIDTVGIGTNEVAQGSPDATQSNNDCDDEGDSSDESSSEASATTESWSSSSSVGWWAPLWPSFNQPRAPTLSLHPEVRSILNSSQSIAPPQAAPRSRQATLNSNRPDQVQHMNVDQAVQASRNGVAGISTENAIGPDVFDRLARDRMRRSHMDAVLGGDDIPFQSGRSHLDDVYTMVYRIFLMLDETQRELSQARNALTQEIAQRDSYVDRSVVRQQQQIQVPVDQSNRIDVLSSSSSAQQVAHCSSSCVAASVSDYDGSGVRKDENLEIASSSTIIDSSRQNILTKNKCCICMEAEIETAFIECGHMVACLECSKLVTRCPICRKKVRKSLRVYRL